MPLAPHDSGGPSLNPEYVATLRACTALMKLMPKQLQPLVLVGLALTMVSFAGRSGVLLVLFSFERDALKACRHVDDQMLSIV